jgi:hypothetical protein
MSKEPPPKKRKHDPVDTAVTSDDHSTSDTPSKVTEEKPIDVTTAAAAASTSSAETNQLLPVTVVDADTSFASVSSSIDSNATTTTPMEDGQAIETLMDTSTTPTTNSFGSSMISVSPELSEHEIRKNLLKDIESHIEIIFECIDEDDEDTVVGDKNIARTTGGSVAAEAPGIAALLKNVQATATAKQASPTQPAPTTPMQVDTPQDVQPTTTNEVTAAGSECKKEKAVEKETMSDTNESKAEVERTEEPEVSK